MTQIIWAIVMDLGGKGALFLQRFYKLLDSKDLNKLISRNKKFILLHPPASKPWIHPSRAVPSCDLIHVIRIIEIMLSKMLIR